MAGETWTWLMRLKAVEREHNAMRLGADPLLVGLQEGTLALGKELRRADINSASDGLEGTYLIRLFSQFERALKRFLRDKKINIPRHAERLINRVAALIGIAGDILANTHKVREYRND